MSKLKLHGAVVFVDAVGRARMAIVTAIWGGYVDPEQDDKDARGYIVATPARPAINVVVADVDDKKFDNYGRQIERYTSVVHGGNQSAHGMYYRLLDEPAKDTEHTALIDP